MEPDMDVLRQVRKALNDIEKSFKHSHGETLNAQWVLKAMYQTAMLRKMVDAEQRQPWSYYQQLVDEEFT